MEYVLNWGILREPINWLTVWTMLLIGWLLFEALSRHPAADLTVNT